MSILAKTFFALVSRHFMSLSFLSAWHNSKDLRLFFLLDCVHEDLGRLECRDIVGRDGHSCLLGDVSGCLFSSVLNNEAAESAEIDRLFPDDRPLYGVHKRLDNGLNCDFLDSG